jgi:type 1 fimbriae regulatory protein FimB/type 1 fimbriae regulatory protein FimE
MPKTQLKLVTPSYFFGPVTRGRPPQRQSDAKARKHLTEAEVAKLMKLAAKANRHGHRDSTMVLVCYRHGLRVKELCELQWDQVDFASAHLYVNRCKRGVPTTQPIAGDELRALRRLKREQKPSPFVFTSERGAPFARAGFRTLLARLGKAAGLGFRCHPHMLRHGSGFKLANDGHDTRAIQDWLGHKNIHHTVRYTALSPARFKNFWR